MSTESKNEGNVAKNGYFMLLIRFTQGFHVLWYFTSELRLERFDTNFSEGISV